MTGAQERSASARIAGTSPRAIAGAVIAVLSLAALALPVPARASAASAAGAALYKDQCSGCHGADGSGDTPIGKVLKVQDLRKPEILARSDADLAAVIAKGKGRMPGFKDKLGSAQIGQLVAYIRTLAKAK